MRFASALQLMPAAWRVRVPLLLAGGLLLGALAFSGLQGTALMAMMAAVGVTFLLMDVFIESQLTSPLQSLQQAAQRVASGDTGEELAFNRCDEIGMIARSINQAGLNLRSLVSDVQEQAGGVRVASAEIAAATHDLSNRTEQSAASLEQTASAMEQQTASVQQNSDTAMQASAAVRHASEVAVRGGQAVNDVVNTMGHISEASRKIAEIISVIDGIAFQTNILALNAAVEAARAGEQGRGFAVVASEVRTLAGRSAAAAKEIKVLIDDSVQTVEQGTRLVGQAGDTMADMVNEVKKVNDMITEITLASKEQAAGIADVGHAVAQLDQSTQQNAAMVEQSSAAAASLSDQAQRLLDAIEVFSLADLRHR
jgi:aerotaxis receptor